MAEIPDLSSIDWAQVLKVERPVITIRVKADHWWQVMLGPLLRQGLALTITVRTDEGYQDLPLVRLAPGDMLIVKDGDLTTSEPMR